MLNSDVEVEVRLEIDAALAGLNSHESLASNKSSSSLFTQLYLITSN